MTGSKPTRNAVWTLSKFVKHIALVSNIRKLIRHVLRYIMHVPALLPKLAIHAAGVRGSKVMETGTEHFGETDSGRAWTVLVLATFSFLSWRWLRAITLLGVPLLLLGQGVITPNYIPEELEAPSTIIKSTLTQDPLTPA